ncbi:MAG: hypothetical protein WCJ74_01930 [bacterium]
MNTNYYNIVIGVGAFLCISMALFNYVKIFRSCKKEVKEKLRTGSTPVEIINGFFRVKNKLGSDTLTLSRQHKGRKVGRIIDVEVPKRLFDRVEIGTLYHFYYNRENHEIHFDEVEKTPSKRHSEGSLISRETMRIRNFWMQRRILDGLNR